MKLEKEMYVRTKKGHIAKIISDIQNDNIGDYYETDKGQVKIIYVEDIASFDYDIKKLVKPRDFVNGSEVIRWHDGELVLFDEGYSILNEIEIESIVTREAFENIAYNMEDYSKNL